MRWKVSPGADSRTTAENCSGLAGHASGEDGPSEAARHTVSCSSSDGMTSEIRPSRQINTTDEFGYSYRRANLTRLGQGVRPGKNRSSSDRQIRAISS